MAGGSSARRELMLRGRRDECAVLDRLLEGARAGRCGVLVLTGEAGAGKAALLEYAVGSASDMRRVRAAGVEAEMELPFAALHQLCVPLLEWLERLPGPQRDALATTFGLSEGAVPDRFSVGLATLGLLSEATEERPLVCVVDDAQWLDRSSAQVLAFVGRRLLAEPVLMLFGARGPSEEFAGLPVLVVEGLGDADARALLASVFPGRLDERVADQIVAETPATRWRCWSFRMVCPPLSWQGASSCRVRYRSRAESKRASSGGFRRCPRTPSGSYSWLRRSLWAIRASLASGRHSRQTRSFAKKMPGGSGSPAGPLPIFGTTRPGIYSPGGNSRS